MSPGGFSSILALAAIVFGVAKPFVQFWERPL